MKQRFVADKTKSTSGTAILSLAIFLVVLCLFLIGIGNVSSSTSEQERETLYSAVNRGVAHCYALEGNYPESIEYLEEHYGLTYDEDRFFVDYQTLGSNIMPDITIIDKEEQ